MMRRSLLLLAAFPVLVDAQDTTSARASLLAADRAAASGAAVSGAAALAKVLTPDASVLVPERNILRGSASYAEALADIAKAPTGRAPWTPLHAVVSRDGTFGCTTGILHLVAADSTQPFTGRYASCWQRTRGGAWRMVALSRASAPPPVKSLPDSLPLAPGSTGIAAAPGVDAARSMTAADRDFAAFSADSGGPAGAFSRWIAGDGMMLGGRAVPVRGPEQAARAFAGFPGTGRFEWRPIDALSASSRDGDLGFTIGEARVAATPTSVSYSKYLTIWRHEGEGRYRFIFDIGSDRPAPPGK